MAIGNQNVEEVIASVAELLQAAPGQEFALSDINANAFQGVKREAKGAYADGGFNIVTGRRPNEACLYVKEKDVPGAIVSAPWGATVTVSGDLCIEAMQSKGYFKLLAKKSRGLRATVAGGAGLGSGPGLGLGQGSAPSQGPGIGKPAASGSGLGARGGGAAAPQGPASGYDAKNESIERQVCLKAASEYLAGIAAANKLGPKDAIDLYIANVGTLASASLAALQSRAAAAAGLGHAEGIRAQGAGQGFGSPAEPEAEALGGEDDLPF